MGIFIGVRSPNPYAHLINNLTETHPYGIIETADITDRLNVQSIFSRSGNEFRSCLVAGTAPLFQNVIR